MKKTLLFAALAVFALCAQAQVWNFSDFEAKVYTEDTVVDGFKIYANEDYPVTVDENTKTVDGVKYTQRIKTGGSSQLDSVTLEPLARVYEFEVSGPGKVEYVITSSSSSGTGRFVNFVVGTDTISKMEAPVKGDLSATGVEKYSFDYTGEAATMRLIFTGGGGVNLYMVAYTAGGENPDTPGNDPVVDKEDLVFDLSKIDATTHLVDVTFGIYTLVVVDDTKGWVVEESPLTFTDGANQYNPSYRAKSGGSKNIITVNAPSEGELVICPRSSNKDATDRNIIVSQNGTKLLEQNVKDVDAVDDLFPAYVVKVPSAGIVTISQNAAINYYYMEFKTSAGVKQVFDLNKVFMSNNVVAANGAQKLMVYDATGRLVRVANAQEVDLNKVARGVYIVKAVYANGETQTVKVRR